MAAASGTAVALDLVVLNETTLMGALWRGLSGHPMQVVATEALVRPLAGLLTRIESWAQRRGLLGSAYVAPAPIPMHDGYPGDALYRPYDPVIERSVRPLVVPFEGHPVLGEYAYAFRKSLSDYTQAMLNLTGAAAWAEANLPVSGWTLIGAPPHFARVFALSAEQTPGAWLGPANAGGRLANALNALAILVGMTAWLVARTRPAVMPEHFRLAIDRVSPIDLEVAKVVDDPAEVLMVERNRRLAAESAPGLARYRRVIRDDARTTPALALRLIQRLARELWALWREFGAMEAPLFGRFAALVGKRALFAAFFHRFRPAFLWGRDDYTTDHIIRNQELRKIGSMSLGVSHGLPINTYVSQWREIDFDTYYVFGRHLYDNFYRNAWPAHMTVKAVGNIQMTPERRARLGSGRMKDIAFFAVETPMLPVMLEQVRRIAEHFPDRTVWVRMKPGRSARYAAIVDVAMREMPLNVARHEGETAYDLMLKIEYALANFSTTGAEALGMRVKVLVFDVDPKFADFYYRNFPGLTVASAEDVIRRIEAIESGQEIYEFSRYESLISMSAPDFRQILRADIGIGAVPTESVWVS